MSISPEKTLVLVPGLICDERIWNGVLADWPSGIQVHIADTNSDDTISGMAARILTEVKGDFAIAGVSMGGYITLEVLNQDRKRVTHFALIDTSAQADAPAARQARLDGIQHVEQGQYEPFIRSLLVDMALGEKSKDNDELVDQLVAMALDVGAGCFIRQSKAILDRKDHTSLLPQCNQPSLVLCGEEDALCPPDNHTKMASLLPAADLVILAECGHSSPVERSAAVRSAILDLLSR